MENTKEDIYEKQPQMFRTYDIFYVYNLNNYHFYNSIINYELINYNLKENHSPHIIQNNLLCLH